MNTAQDARGGAPVAELASLPPWEARLIRNLRHWFDGADGQAQVWADYLKHLPAQAAAAELRGFEHLLRLVLENASRPLVRHAPDCICVGSDECIFANLVSTASDGLLGDAALISTLLVGPAQAELVAVLAGQVGAGLRTTFEGTGVAKPAAMPGADTQLLH